MLRSTISILLFLPTLGCSSFDSDFQEPVEGPAEDPFVGAWVGTWTSEVNQHTGDLRAIVTMQGEQQYDVRYHATYTLGFLPLTFEYTTPVRAEATNDGLRLTGEADLGWLAGGMYRYDGMVRGDEYHCRYESESDHGVFEMARPVPEADDAEPEPGS